MTGFSCCRNDADKLSRHCIIASCIANGHEQKDVPSVKRDVPHFPPCPSCNVKKTFNVVRFGILRTLSDAEQLSMNDKYNIHLGMLYTRSKNTLHDQRVLASFYFLAWSS